MVGHAPQDSMGNREILSILWHGHHFIDVTYDVGEADFLIGTREMAAGLAQDEGLVVVPTEDHKGVVGASDPPSA